MSFREVNNQMDFNYYNEKLCKKKMKSTFALLTKQFAFA